MLLTKTVSNQPAAIFQRKLKSVVYFLPFRYCWLANKIFAIELFFRLFFIFKSAHHQFQKPSSELWSTSNLIHQQKNHNNNRKANKLNLISFTIHPPTQSRTLAWAWIRLSIWCSNCLTKSFCTRKSFCHVFTVFQNRAEWGKEFSFSILK